MTDQDPTAAASTPYRVLARKYRPATFDELIGQEVMVKTLTNAMEMGRLAHAFILTGVRGVGKTTTARIIARALNCIGPDGNGDATPLPCGQCSNCVAIAEDRHVDVMEMDAASRTGVDDIREIIEGVRYRPVSARTKVYIIDEVHMLSKNAFNALLKTLEEPPDHVTFIFATTEIRKVPITVLSRCQRFDLRRVDMAVLQAHLGDIAARESANVDENALAVLARAADGSVRDGLSLLDQAISQASGPISAADVREMLGLADRTQIFDLFDHLMTGAIKEAIELLGVMYRAGADPVVVIQDLLEHTHWVTRMKVARHAASVSAVSDTERLRGEKMAEALSLPVLARAWQMLLRGLDELQRAPQPLATAEMVFVRLAYAADLPPPVDLVRRLTDQVGAPVTEAAQRASTAHSSETPPSARRAVAGQSGRAAAQPDREDNPAPATFAEMVALFEAHRERDIVNHLTRDVHLVGFETGRIELRPTDRAPRQLANRIGQLLSDWTGERWIVAVSQEEGDATLAEQHRQVQQAARDDAARHPVVRAVLETFPGATIEAVRDVQMPTATADDFPSDDSEE